MFTAVWKGPQKKKMSTKFINDRDVGKVLKNIVAARVDSNRSNKL